MTKDEFKKEIQESIDYAQGAIDAGSGDDTQFESEEEALAHISALEWVLKKLDTLA